MTCVKAMSLLIVNDTDDMSDRARPAPSCMNAFGPCAVLLGWPHPFIPIPRIVTDVERLCEVDVDGRFMSTSFRSVLRWYSIVQDRTRGIGVYE